MVVSECYTHDSATFYIFALPEILFRACMSRLTEQNDLLTLIIFDAFYSTFNSDNGIF